MNYKLTLPNAKCPSKKSIYDAGWDLYSPIAFILPEKSIVTINTGFQCKLPVDTFAVIKGRSKLAARGLNVLGGVVDNNYRGDWGVVLHNCSNVGMSFEIGEAIAQFIILPYITSLSFYNVESLPLSDRGSRGIWDEDYH